ncbi:MAG: DUF6502 family protein [Rhodospirillales bacterium]|nr:DUF6502 family protein [Rhodospirillales bacterium]
MSASPGGPGSAPLLPGLHHLLRPLVRLLILRGVTFPMLADLLRDLYVDVARRDVLREPRAQTDSRISLLTGVHRKELRRQRTAPPAPEPEALSLGSLVIARWLAIPPWCGADGSPLPLPRAAAGGEPSFDGLVASVTRDMRPRAVLDEWLSQGIVRLDAAERVVLNAAAYLPRPGSAEQLHYFARNLHDHIAAATANVATGTAPPFLDRSVHYDALPPEIAARLLALARARAERLLLEVNRSAVGMLEEAPPLSPAGPTRRVNLGLYLYDEDDPPKGAA